MRLTNDRGTPHQYICPYTGTNVVPKLVFYLTSTEQPYTAMLLYTIQRQAQIRLNHYLAKFMRSQMLRQSKSHRSPREMFNPVTRFMGAAHRMYGATPVTENIATITLATDSIFTIKGSFFTSYRVLLALALHASSKSLVTKSSQLAHQTNLLTTSALSVESLGSE
jgi:hypothetical protein